MIIFSIYLFVYDYYFSPQTVGVIDRMERDSFQVLSMHGKVISINPTCLEKRKIHLHTLALDSESNQIRRNDIVKILLKNHAVSFLRLSFFKIINFL